MANTSTRHTKAPIPVIIAAIVCVIAMVAAVTVSVRSTVVHMQTHEALIRQEQLTEQYDFNPGNIIADQQFFDADALTETQIQDFLDTQGESCTGSQCLKNAAFEVEDRAADTYCGAYEADASGKERAASIIYHTQRACSVSAKVLLTMLQKEQQLVTATDPTDAQYASAMGLSCPDDDQCDAVYSGFFNQVFGSAQRYQYYVHHESDYRYHANALNYVYFNPDAGCGGTNVYIENKSTALLYIYTPYQPNIAALAAGAGEGDACSAYGNRNFSIIYENWFGNPRTE